MCLESCSNQDLGCDPRSDKRARNRAAKAAHRARVNARKQFQTAPVVAGSNLNRSREVVLNDADLSARTLAAAPYGGSI